MLASKKSEARKLLRSCFKAPIFSAVPFEIWGLILKFCSLNCFCTMRRSCWGFKELVCFLNVPCLNDAFEFRKEGLIQEARDLLLRAAIGGNSSAMAHLAFTLRSGGWGFKRNDERAVLWAKCSAELGNGHGLALYARLAQDTPDGKSWSQKALESGDDFALAYCYDWGIGTERNREQSTYHYERAAMEGDEVAQYNLAQNYGEGAGVALDHNMEFAWYMKGALQGSSGAQTNVGAAYSVGSGVEKDLCKSFEWYMKAAVQESFVAQHAIGYFYEHGMGGCSKDLDLAMEWYKKAASQNFEISEAALKGILEKKN